jgi:tight adherence protein C
LSFLPAFLCGAATGMALWFGLPLVPAPRRRLARRDRRRCFAELPEFLELLALCLSSGQSIGAAWPSTVRNVPPGPLRIELDHAARMLGLGRPAPEVMTELAERLGDARGAMALSLVAQSMARGNPLEPVLLSQASALRRLRMMEIERRAQTAPLRMMAPVFGLIFPAVLLLLLAPVLLKLAQGGSLF